LHGQPTATGSLLIGLESFWKKIFVIAVNKLNFKDTCLTSLPLAERAAVMLNAIFTQLFPNHEIT